MGNGSVLVTSIDRPPNTSAAARAGSGNAAASIECVARGYLSGSGWKDYQATGEVCGIKLPAGLRESDRLPQPIFTPATKAQSGHDINISEAEAAHIVGQQLLDRVRDLTLRLYAEGAAHAESCGIIVADTKFEFGLLPNDKPAHERVMPQHRRATSSQRGGRTLCRASSCRSTSPSCFISAP